MLTGAGAVPCARDVSELDYGFPLKLHCLLAKAYTYRVCLRIFVFVYTALTLRHIVVVLGVFPRPRSFAFQNLATAQTTKLPLQISNFNFNLNFDFTHLPLLHSRAQLPARACIPQPQRGIKTGFSQLRQFRFTWTYQLLAKVVLLLFNIILETKLFSVASASAY